MGYGGSTVTKLCATCGHMLQDGDSILFAGKAIYRAVPSTVTFALSDISECRNLMHEFCGGEEQ